MMVKENQRVALSKRMLKEGLMALLKKKNIRKISVNELCETAEINRTTFYRHYQTPHDVLIDIELDFAKLAQEKPLPSTARGDIFICLWLPDSFCTKDARSARRYCSFRIRFLLTGSMPSSANGSLRIFH